MPIYESPIPLQTHRSKAKKHGLTEAAGSDESSDDISEGHDHDDNDDDDDDYEVPPEFPAAPMRRDKGEQQALPPKPKTQRNLKRQHFAVLTAILHKCLAEGDYERASRTFGLLLRFEINGQQANLRTRGLWGIGSEILLHRGPADADTDDGLPFRERGLQEARAYFDRLMLEYPHRKLSARYLNELHLLPAILGLEIVQLQAKIERARQRSDAEAPGEMEALQGEVRSIADRLDDKLAFPPFDRDAGLLRLKGDVWSWMADLQGGGDGEDGGEWRDIAREAYTRADQYTRSLHEEP